MAKFYKNKSTIFVSKNKMSESMRGLTGRVYTISKSNPEIFELVSKTKTKAVLKDATGRQYEVLALWLDKHCGIHVVKESKAQVNTITRTGYMVENGQIKKQVKVELPVMVEAIAKGMARALKEEEEVEDEMFFDEFDTEEELEDEMEDEIEDEMEDEIEDDADDIVQDVLDAVEDAIEDVIDDVATPGADVASGSELYDFGNSLLNDGDLTEEEKAEALWNHFKAGADSEQAPVEPIEIDAEEDKDNPFEEAKKLIKRDRARLRKFDKAQLERYSRIRLGGKVSPAQLRALIK